MTIINEKYKKLKPELEYLSDEVVLAQAWKKSHAYIRSHNWYADTLELDCSAINLEQRIKDWAKQLRDGEYSPFEMRLIPAPKPDCWTFFKGKSDSDKWMWGPKPKLVDDSAHPQLVSKSKELRPLAHLDIQDQTVATAIMLCLADAVETAQGSTDPERKHQVYSYGNRLFCDWNGEHARFRWGNSNTYSKYFQDYQRFLERPMRMAQEIQQFLAPTESIYEIHLDLSAFYDTIDRKRLIRILRRLAEDHYGAESEQSDKFWETVKQTFEGWQWAEQDEALASCLKNGKLPAGKGLPQGLVASGFFANAYLLEVDKRLSALIGNLSGEVTLIDYCRYVDDMRLLVHVPTDNEHGRGYWEKWVGNFIQPHIEKTKGLELNLDKTKIERYTAKRSGVSVRMKAVQEAASGPQDRAALDEMLGSLEGLFTLAEQLRDQDELTYRDCDLPLALVDQPQMDVRNDTILRFSANRITRALADKRLLAEDDGENNENIKELDHVYESIARRFVGVWARNPSLVAILKKGFSLFPHPQLLHPVCDTLLEILQSTKTGVDNNSEQRIAYYCLAEIFRFAALELHRQLPEERPKHADWEGFLILLSHLAKKVLKVEDAPWYVLQQIALFLAINNEPIRLPQKDELYDYRLLHRILLGDRRFGATDAIERRVPLFIVAYQVSNNNLQVVTTAGDWLDRLQDNKSEEFITPVLDIIALNNPSMFNKIREYSHQVQSEWCLEADEAFNRYGFNHGKLLGKLSEYDNKPVSLASVVMRNDNPFAHENALLALSCAVLNMEVGLTSKRQLAPHHLKIRCKSWQQIQHAENLGALLKLEWSTETTDDDRYVRPAWLSGDKDSKKLYRLGSFLRACAIGNMDFTAGQYLMREDTSHAYWGLRSCWFKRRIGMSHQPEALNGKTAPMSSWVSELLYRLLQWPGLELREFDDVWPLKMSLDSVTKLINDRLKVQKELYGKASDIPVYIERIHHEPKDHQHLRVVMVQSLLPKKDDIEKEDLQFNRVNFRAKHRSHFATMAKLVCDKLVAAQRASNEKSTKPLADLIIFPELSVHPDDIGLLKRLADKTGAMIFTGLTYQQLDENIINTALWLIPFKNGHGRQWIIRFQGKQHLTKGEQKLGIKPWRPYQLVIELTKTLVGQPDGFRLSGAICYDATNIGLATDLKDITNTFIVSALNQDVDTFDTMVDALHYHMFQPVILVNTGEFGGSAAKAPYKEKFHKQIAHVHGSNQIAISMFDLNMYDFGKPLSPLSSGKLMKTAPAGLKRIK